MSLGIVFPENNLAEFFFNFLGIDFENNVQSRLNKNGVLSNFQLILSFHLNKTSGLHIQNYTNICEVWTIFYANAREGYKNVVLE